MGGVLERRLRRPQGLLNVIGIRALGLAGAVELAPVAGSGQAAPISSWNASTNSNVMVQPAEQETVVVCRLRRRERTSTASSMWWPGAIRSTLQALRATVGAMFK
jgi:hypothetical protein